MDRILFFIETTYGGGAERVTVNIANCLAKKGYQIYICRICNSERSYSISDNVKIFDRDRIYDIKLLDFASRFFYICKCLRVIKPQFSISLSMFSSNFLISIAGLFSKSKIVLSERNDPRRFPKQKVKKLLRDFSYYMSDGLVLQTEYVKKLFPACISRKAVVIANPVCMVEHTKSIDRNKVIINCSRLDKQKNLKLLLEAFSDIAKRYNDFSLEIYGEGRLKHELEKYGEELLIKDRFTIYSYVDNVIEKMRQAYMYVSSSDYEGISNSMLEALATGMPVICTDCPVGGASMVIKNGENGLLVPVNDRKKLAEAMEKIILDENFAKRIGENARQSIEKYNIDCISDQWITYLGQL